MGFNDTTFNTSGKIPTNANFWDGAVDEFVTSDGITSGFGKVIAEQVYRPINMPVTPFYNKFAGRVLPYGEGWTERAINRTAMRKFKPKATASDALQFYDSTGIEKTFSLNVGGWIPVTLPSGLESAEMMLKNDIGTLNSRLVDNVMMEYQVGMEADCEKFAVSMTKNEKVIASTDPIKYFTAIRDLVTEMQGNDTQYNALTTTENAGILTNSRKVYCFVNAKIWNAYQDAQSAIPNPDKLIMNCEVIPCVNAIATPLTTAEYNAGPNADDSTSLAWTNKPPALDKKAPTALVVSADAFEYRPYQGSYKVNIDQNGAGDFTNQHLIFKGALAYRPWENAVRINETSA